MNKSAIHQLVGSSPLNQYTTKVNDPFNAIIAANVYVILSCKLRDEIRTPVVQHTRNTGLRRQLYGYEY